MTPWSNATFEHPEIGPVMTGPPSASIHYVGTPFCNASGRAQASLIGQRGGIYSASPAGLIINTTSGTIDLAKCLPGVYTVTYAIAYLPSTFITSTSIEIGQAIMWYADADEDGIGTEWDSLASCDQPAGYVIASGDDCPFDPDKLSPGICGCGVPDLNGDEVDAMNIHFHRDGLINASSASGELYMSDTPEKETPHADLISLYPNPSLSGFMVLRMDGLDPGVKQAVIEIHDASGGRLLTETVPTIGLIMLERRIDLAHLSSGNYVMIVEMGGQHWARSVVLR